MATENKAALNGAVPVYVFPASRREQAVFVTGDSLAVIYRKPQHSKTDYFAPDTITYQGARYPLERKLYGCGVFRVACIFVAEVR